MLLNTLSSSLVEITTDLTYSLEIFVNIDKL